MSQGFVYILSNPSFPNLLKIGRTTRDVDKRAEELFTSGVPTEFVVEFSVKSPDCDELEAAIHLKLAEKRYSHNREFFKCDISDAFPILQELHRDQISEWVKEFSDLLAVVVE